MIKLTTPTVKHQATDIIDVLSPTKEAIQLDMTQQTRVVKPQAANAKIYVKVHPKQPPKTLFR
jgi:hypothetical protein